VWVETSGQVVFIHSYSVLVASGHNGPKLREGDRQVPEGFYRITSLNPNSSYHLSIKLNYPNAFDQQHADEEGRDRLGGDIFIHGKAASIGCLAMGRPGHRRIVCHGGESREVECASNHRPARSTPNSIKIQFHPSRLDRRSLQKNHRCFYQLHKAIFPDVTNWKTENICLFFKKI
jgi:L,D-transpeptidase catalytic domain